MKWHAIHNLTRYMQNIFYFFKIQCKAFTLFPKITLFFELLKWCFGILATYIFVVFFFLFTCNVHFSMEFQILHDVKKSKVLYRNSNFSLFCPKRTFATSAHNFLLDKWNANASKLVTWQPQGPKQPIHYACFRHDVTKLKNDPWWKLESLIDFHWCATCAYFFSNKWNA